MHQKNQKKYQCISEPINIPIDQPCQHIVAGPNHSYAIAEECVYFWGKKQTCHMLQNNNNKNSYAQSQEQLLNESLVTIPIKVDELATGPGHTFAWNSKEVYCWGSNQYYELKEEQSYGCQKVQLFSKALEQGFFLQAITCGEHHSLAVIHRKSSKKYLSILTQIIDPQIDVIQRQNAINEQKQQIQLYAWGESQSYQLTINTNSILPQPVISPCSFRKLQQLYSKSDYNMAICNGRVYSWGSNLFSRLGITHMDFHHQLQISTQPKIRVPRLVILPNKIIKIGIGVHHVVAVAVSGEAYSWGKGNQGQLGTDKYQTESKPNQIICQQIIVDASCGDSHTIVLLKDGRMKSCGSNQHSVLGHSLHDPKDKKKRCKKLQFIPNLQQLGQIKQISCGSHHNLILNSLGKVFGWGSNQYFQIMPEMHKQDESTSHLQHKPSKQLKKALQITVDVDQNQQQVTEIKALSAAERLLDWKKRFTQFKQQKIRQQQLLLRQLQQIMRKMNTNS